MLKNLLIKPVYAAINNPALNPTIGGSAADSTLATSGEIFTNYFLNIWKAMMSIGALMVLLFYVWGAIMWISGGDDSAKIGKARDKMIQATIGLIILVASYAIIGFISTLFFGGVFDILNLTFGG